MRFAAAATVLACITHATNEVLFDYGWKFNRADSSPSSVRTSSSSEYKCNAGALAAGNDLGTKQFSIADAEAHCDSLQTCVGFTYENTHRHPGTFYFKSSRRGNTDSSWQVCLKQAPPEPATCNTPFCEVKYDDSSWHGLNLPHDWSAEDLPPREQDATATVLTVRNGTWQFHTGDNASWSAPTVDDHAGGWSAVAVPHDWRDPPTSYTARNSYGWYRRTITLSPLQAAAARQGRLTLALGTVGAWDQTFFDGKQVGTTGADADANADAGGNPTLNCKDYLTYRKYNLPVIADARASSSSSGGGGGSMHVVAVRVFSAGGPPDGDWDGDRDGEQRGKPGGLVDTGSSADARIGPFDAGASPGQRQTGYTVGGTGWYRKTFSIPSASAAASGAAGVPKAGAKRYALRFDGVYMNADVWLNGVHLGAHPYGYTTFSFDITTHLKSNKNVVAVRVRNEGANSRWYSGSGIYRHVWLVETSAFADVAEWGLGVTTPTVDPAARTAMVKVTAELVGSTGSSTGSSAVSVGGTPVLVTTTIYAPPPPPPVSGTGTSINTALRTLGPAVATHNQTVTLTAAGAAVASTSFDLKDVSLWDVYHRGNGTTSASASGGGYVAALYTAVVTVGPPPSSSSSSFSSSLLSSSLSSSTSTTFGIRTISFTPSGGFTLNGRAGTKLQGGCVHHDNGLLGSRAIDRADERRVELLRAQGYNAIRTSHNPVSPAFLDACDRLGVVVMDEAFDCWRGGKNPDDYHLDFDAWWERDVTSMVRRDRNHPSVVMWSIGNEIPIKRSAAGIALSHNISSLIRSLDPSCIHTGNADGGGSGRAVTTAYNGPKGDELTDAFLAPLDVAGYNYAPQRYALDHARIPSRVFAGTESFPMASLDAWSAVWRQPSAVGDFIWTAIDYIGESAIGGNGYNTPDINACDGYCPQGYGYHVSFCGDLDLVGHRKPQSRYRAVLWNVSQLEVSVHAPIAKGEKEAVASWGYPDLRQSWTWEAAGAGAAGGESGDPLLLDVEVNSRHAHVRLFLNGKPISPLTPAGEANGFRAIFNGVAYAPGALTAVGYNGAGGSSNRTLRTAGAPARLALSADRASIRADPRDLSFVTAAVTDAAGVVVPGPLARVTFALQSATTAGGSGGGGAARVVAVGNGDPTNLASFTGTSSVTYRGRCLAIVQPEATQAGGVVSAGPVILVASSPGLLDARITINMVADA